MTEMNKTETERVVDPICGMTIDPTTAVGKYKQDGANYYFCSKACLQKFVSSPEEKSGGCCSM